MENKGTNRWFVVFGAVLLQLCLGAIYSWSLFNQPLVDKFGWEKDSVLLTFSIAIFVFAAATLISGRLQDQIGPRKVAMIGGVLYGGGMILASFATSLPMMYISYGVIAGAGVGFAYVCPLSTCVKWFPEKKGFITGIAVGAFGLGSMVFKSVIEFFLNTTGVSQTFMYVGLIYMVLVLIGAQFLKVPETTGTAKTAAKAESKNFTVGEMLKEKSFLPVWFMYLVGCLPGLLVIGLAKDIGVEMAKLDPAVAANAVGLIALFNAGGRLGWGTVSDKLGRIQVVLILFVLTIGSLLYLRFMPLNMVTFFISLAAIACSFGGFLSVFPTIVSDFYGVKNLGANYGVVFQAYGIAAIAGPFLKKGAGSLGMTFIIAAGFAVIGAVLAMIVKGQRAAVAKTAKA